MAVRKKAAKKAGARPVSATKKGVKRPAEVGRKRTKAQRRANVGKPEGKPRFRPTDEQRAQVEKMVGMGLTYKQIASLTINAKTMRGISTSTLQQSFPIELETGQPKALALVAQSLFSKAVSANHPQAAICAMFFLKCRGGWRQEDKLVHEIEGNTGVLVAPAMITPAEWIKRAQDRNEGKKSPADD